MDATPAANHAPSVTDENVAPKRARIPTFPLATEERETKR